jgi:hypothetical protein
MVGCVPSPVLFRDGALTQQLMFLIEPGELGFERRRRAHAWSIIIIKKDVAKRDIDKT